ncbi:unnamed protein product [Meganyctiphanes norvegica]|uniref:Uncharacterized protein n=1 Tax=Meganyctiphanes norvegica TaxID=48144 RepID=A0AAV2QVU4_MEGNR
MVINTEDKNEVQSELNSETKTEEKSESSTEEKNETKDEIQSEIKSEVNGNDKSEIVGNNDAENKEEEKNEDNTEKNKKKKGKQGPCGICGKDAHQSCSQCSSVYYCSRDCQREDWKIHKSKCRPFVIGKHKIYGRHAVANRDIAAGELIMREKSIIIGPRHRGAPVCLGCHGKPTPHFTCSKCKYPLCSPDCESSRYHQAECPYLEKAPCPPISDLSAASPAYECIMPLRCLLQNEPKLRKQIDNLQSHVEDIKRSPLDADINKNIIQFLKERVGWSGPEAEIYKMAGVLITNGMEMQHNQNTVRGIFPSAAMLAHDCVPNAKYYVSEFTHDGDDSDPTMYVYATVPISKGTSINFTYTGTLYTTLPRRQHLQFTKFFPCTCRRCSDPTELGTDFGTLVCDKTDCKGYVESCHPMHALAPWRCRKCHQDFDVNKVKMINESVFQELSSIDRTTPKPLEDFLNKHQDLLHPNHRFYHEAKYGLIQRYGNRFPYNEINKSQMENKIKWCRELLKLADIFSPGMSTFRGDLKFELHAALSALSTHVRKFEPTVIVEEIESEAKKLQESAREILEQNPDNAVGLFAKRLDVLHSQIIRI